MTTDALLYPGQTLTLGVDGRHPSAPIISGDGCADVLCAGASELACSFLDLLPTGPMWDCHKQEAREVIGFAGAIPEPLELSCTTLVNYALFVGQYLSEIVSDALAPAILESRPHTATATLSDWLVRLGWSECYKNACRSERDANLSPYEILGECGLSYSEPTFDADFDCALNYAIVQSLSRLRRGVIPNIDGINWVIEPLGAAVSPAPYSTEIQDFLDGNCDVPNGPPCWCGELGLEVCNIATTLPACPTYDCVSGNDTVPAEQTYSRPGEPDIQLFPGVLAAECIVKSLLNDPCPNIVSRCGA